MNRRTFLARGTVLGVAGLAGCTGVLDDSGTGNGSTGGDSGANAANGDSDDGASGSYDAVARWAVSAEGSAEPPYGYSVMHRSASRMLALDDDLSIDLAARMQQRLQYVWGAPDPATLDHEISVTTPDGFGVPSYSVYRGSFDDEAARTQIESNAEEHVGSHEGYDLYTGVSRQSSTIRAYAVGDGTVVEVGAFAEASGTADHLRRILDASAGATDTVVDQQAPLQRVTDRIDPGVVSLVKRIDPASETNVASGSFTGVSAIGSTGSIDGSTLSQSIFFHFESADAAGNVSVDSYLSALRSQDSTKTAEANLDGRYLQVTTRADAKTALGL